MKLVELTVKDYLDLLKSDAPAPGGGSVSALSAAQGIGLVAMVSDLTIGRERYADFEEGCKKAKAEAIELYAKLVEAIDKDTEAFNQEARQSQMQLSRQRKFRSRHLRFA